MGQYFKVVNLTKRQYFSAGIFDESIKKSGILRGIHAYALGKLLTIGLPEENEKWKEGNSTGIWAGSWAGDRLAVTGDETCGHLPALEAPDPQTQSFALNDMVVREFENIGGIMICWLVNDEDFAEWLLDRLRRKERYTGDIGCLAYKYRHLSEELIVFLDTHFTKSWEKQCKQIWEDRGNTFHEPV